ncbi:hypothetical protein ACFRCI_20115 [Streptomyces sp. NPDC056638]|uniref:hypothetical protein n=1 Tax=Streptomyces sp. NPDC056638 TaxID=3345887 RepID=UPI00368F977C
MGQSCFATVSTDWMLTYDVSRPHQIGIEFPPEDREQVRRRLFAAVQGCEVLRITTADGIALPTWDTATDEEEQALISSSIVSMKPAD